MKACDHVYKADIDDLNIFNILIFDGKYNPTDRLKLHIDSFKLQYPKMKHHLFFKDEVREIIKNNFDSDIVVAFDKLRPYAYKSDLARLCLLYKFGGIYSDISHIHLSPIIIEDDTRLVFFRGAGGLNNPPFLISNSVVFARPGQKEILDLINIIAKNTKSNYYGMNRLDITGPYTWGRYISSLQRFDGITFGDVVRTVHGMPKKSTYHTLSKYMPDGRLICIKNKSKNSSVEEFLDGGNSYAKMWKNREVYKN